MVASTFGRCIFSAGRRAGATITASGGRSAEREVAMATAIRRADVSPFPSDEESAALDTALSLVVMQYEELAGRLSKRYDDDPGQDVVEMDAWGGAREAGAGGFLTATQAWWLTQLARRAQVHADTLREHADRIDKLTEALYFEPRDTTKYTPEQQRRDYGDAADVLASIERYARSRGVDHRDA
jgi:hypothetical protein